MPEPTEPNPRSEWQRRSWAANREWRARRLALGAVRSVAAAHPDDTTFLTEVLDTIREAQRQAVPT